MAETLTHMYGVSLGATLLLELLMALAFRIRKPKDLLLVVLVNMLTNPAAVLFNWLGTQYLQDIWSIFCQIPIELLVVLAEGCIYDTFKRNTTADIRHPFWFSVAANLFSWGCGVLLG